MMQGHDLLLAQHCWLHGFTLWALRFETLLWECPLDGCNSGIKDETVIRREMPLKVVPPLFGFTQALP